MDYARKAVVIDLRMPSYSEYNLYDFIVPTFRNANPGFNAGGNGKRLSLYGFLDPDH